jgi:hypothetical protein
LIEQDATELERQARLSVVRSLVFYAVVLAADLAVLLYVAVIAGPPQGFGWVTLAITVLLGLLLMQQVWQHARDASAVVEETEDTILRKFQRAELIFVWQNNYLQVGRAIFSVAARDYILVKEGQFVRVRHFPRTLKVVSVETVG